MPSTPIRDAAGATGHVLDDAQIAAAEHLEDLLWALGTEPGGARDRRTGRTVGSRRRPWPADAPGGNT